MSSYLASDDQQSNDSAENRYKNLFQTEDYLSSSLDILETWKQHTSLQPIEYLEKQAKILKKQSSLLISAYQVRTVAFCEMLLKAFRQIIEQYQKAYKAKDNALDRIGKLDQKLYKIVKYLHLAEMSYWVNFFNDLYATKLQQIYEYLRKALLYCIDLEVLWITLISPKMFRKQQNYNIYKYSLSGNKNFYQKQITQAKRKYLNHSNCFNQSENATQLVRNIGEIIADEKIKQAHKIKCIFLIKGQFYQKQPPKSLKESFILESLKVYNCDQLSESWDHSTFQNLCFQVLEKAQYNHELLICLLYMEPELIDFRHRKRIYKFAKIFNNILGDILSLNDRKPSKQMNLPFLHLILDSHHFQLFVCLLVNFQGSSKQIYLIDDPQLHKTFLEVTDKMKKLYSIFMTDLWVIPISIINSITLKFFWKFSDDFSSEILAVLPKMIHNLVEDKMPIKIILQKSEDNQYTLCEKKATKLEYLAIIFSYIDDYISKYPQEYIELPDLYPTDLYTAILFVRSLELRLKHHNPSSQETKKNYSQILQLCTGFYKLTTTFNWYKNKQQICSLNDREVQFVFHRQLKQKWAHELFQDLLNYRDSNKNQKFTGYSNNNQISLLHQVIPYLKYSIGMSYSQSRYYQLQDQDLFSLLQKMAKFAQTIQDIFKMSMEQELNLNYLHTCLKFYNTKIKQAKDSEIYFSIVQKIVLPWIQARSEIAEPFKKTYSQFFMHHNMTAQYVLIGDSIINFIVDNEDDDSYQKDIVTKIDFFCEAPGKMIEEITPDNAEQLLSKILSIFSPDFNIAVFMPLCDMFLFILEHHQNLKQNFSLDYAVDFILQQERLAKILQTLKSNSQARNSKAIRQSFLNKFGQLLPQLSFKSAFSLLVYIQNYYNINCSKEQAYEARKKILSKIVIEAQKPQIIIIKSVLAYTNLKAAQKIEDTKQSEQIFLKFQELSQKWQNTNKISLKTLLPQSILKLVKQQLTTMKTQIKIQQSEQIKEINKITNIFVRIWCSQLVQKQGTLEDIIYFEQDILNYVKVTSNNNDSQIGTSIIKQNRVKYQYFKKIINKLPVLEQCAQQAINTIEQPTPELICKLILINSKYQSQKLQQYILGKLEIFNGLIPIKIYQNYLIKQVRKQLHQIPDDFFQKILYKPGQATNNQNLQKINDVFYKIICLPIKKFDVVEIDKAIQQNQHKKTEGDKSEKDQEQWKTQSQGENDKQSIHLSQPDNIKNGSENSINSGQQNNSDDQNEYQDCDEKPPMVQMFYEQNENILKYKEHVHLREQIDLIIEGNYLKSLQKYRQNSEYVEIIQKLVKVLETISQQTITEHINRKMPQNLYKQLQSYGYTKTFDNQKYLEQLKPQKNLPKFLQDGGEYISEPDYQSDDNYEGDSDDDFQSQRDQQQRNQNYQTSSDDSQYDQQGNQIQKQKKQVSSTNLTLSNKNSQNYQDQMTIQLPDLKQVNSKIQVELSGHQFSVQQLRKILEISVFKLFTFSSSEKQLKSIILFYKQILSSKFLKVFVDTVLAVVRVDQKYNREQRYELSRHLNQMGMSIRKAVDSFVQFCKLAKSSQNQNIAKQILNDCGELLPIGTTVVLKSDIPIQDNILTLFILLTKLKQTSTHDRLKQFIESINSSIKFYKFTKGRAKILTSHMYQNDCSTWIWKFIDENLNNVNTEKNIENQCCVSIYGKMLREEIQRSIDLKKIGQKQQQLPFIYQEIVAENLLKTFGKKIKYYYFWTKKCLDDMDPVTSNFKKYLQNKELIKLTEFMIFYIRAMKLKFHQKTEQKTFQKIIKLPQKILKTTFMYLYFSRKHWETSNWQSLDKVRKFFDNYNYSEYTFNRLEEMCNLMIDFSDLEIFCTPKYKEIFLRFLVKNPNVSKNLPLMFKAPRIPEQADGQRVYVTRQCSFDMAMYQLKGKALLVQFHQEEGSDYGGMVRELMMGWKGVGIGEQAFFIGKVLGISFKNAIPYGGEFDISMAIAITNFKIDMQFLKQHDKVVYQSLKYIQDNDPEDLELKFILTKQKYGVVKQYPLKQQGQKIQVNQQNKKQYIQLYLKQYYLCGRQWQLSQLKNGFNTIVYESYIQIFNPVELIQKIRGQQVSDYMKLKKKAKYQQGYTENSPIIKWLWQIISKFTQLQMNKFIQFLTGAPKVSLYDPYFSFTVEKTYEDDEQRLPVAHTCFNTLDLPEYSSKEALQAKLKQAIFEGNDNFGIL